MAQILGDTENIAGGNDGALQTDFPTSVTKVFVEPAEGGHGDRGRLRPGCRRRTNAKPSTGFNEFDFPSINGSPPTVVGGGDMSSCSRTARPRGPWSTYLATPAGGDDLGEARAASRRRTRTCAPSAYPDPIEPRDRAGARAGEDLPVRPLRPAARLRSAARPVRASGSSSRTSCKNPKNVDGIAQQLEKAAAKAYKQVARLERRRASRAEPPRRGLRRAPGQGSWRRYAVAAAFLAPARVLPRHLDRLPGDHDDRAAASSIATGRQFVGFDNYQRAVHDRHARRRRSRTTRSGSPSCPRSSPRSGSSSRCSPSASAGRSRSRPPCSCRWPSRSSPRA